MNTADHILVKTRLRNGVAAGGQDRAQGLGRIAMDIGWPAKPFAQQASGRVAQAGAASGSAAVYAYEIRHIHGPPLFARRGDFVRHERNINVRDGAFRKPYNEK